MWKLNVFLLPCKNFSKITYEEAKKFDDRITELSKQETFQIPREFFDTRDVNQQTVYDMIFEGQSDLSDYLLELLSKERTVNETYAKIEFLKDYAYTAILNTDVDESKETLTIFETKDKEDTDNHYRGIIPNDIVMVKRSYLKQCNTFLEFEEKAAFGFHRLIFHPDAFIYISKLGKYDEVIDELMRHLCALNDYADRIYEYVGRNEKKALQEIQSYLNIYCSGKGANETKTYNKDMMFEGKKYTLTCNPRTKLFKKYSDQRIYFCWGRDEIDNHKIIIIRIGNHWDEE